MEALARKLLSDAVQKPRARRPASVQLLVQRLYECRMPERVVDDFLAERRKIAGEE